MPVIGIAGATASRVSIRLSGSEFTSLPPGSLIVPSDAPVAASQR